MRISRSTIASAKSALAGLQERQRPAAHDAARQVRIDEEEGEWQVAKRKRRRKKAENATTTDGHVSSPSPPSTARPSNPTGGLRTKGRCQPRALGSLRERDLLTPRMARTRAKARTVFPLTRARASLTVLGKAKGRRRRSRSLQPRS